MLTKRQNLLETIRGGNPDRYVNQFEAFKIVTRTPFSLVNKAPKKGELNVVNAWGVTRSWPADNPGPFPVHDKEHILVQDVEHWKEKVTVPSVIFTDEEWAPFVKEAEAIDRNEYFVTAFVAPGVFEQLHYFMEMTTCMMNFYEYPDEMHEMIDMLTEWELAWAKELCDHLHPDALLHHDDWGSRTSSFISPDMFEEFIVPAYKKIYGYYKSRGVEVIIHHSDSYGRNLVPHMIDIGIDIWQGCMRANNIPEMIEEFGGKISFMCGLDNQDFDEPKWTPENVKRCVHQAIKEGSKNYFIPCAAGGGPGCTFEGVYELITSEIEAINNGEVEL